MNINNNNKREIKIRAWNPVDKVMIHANQMCQYGTTSDAKGIRYGFDAHGCHFMMYEKHIINPIQDFILMQATGLKDINGKEIFEGDIVRMPTLYETPEMTPTYYDNWGVSFDFGQFNLFNSKYIPEIGCSSLYDEYESYDGNFEIVGNVYENPDLIKK